MHSTRAVPRNARTKLNKETMTELRDAFDIFDSTKSGGLDGRELKSAIRALGFDVKSEDIRKMMTDIGKDPASTVDFSEFVEVMEDRMQRKGTREEVMRIFELFDEDRQGKITFKNLKRISQEIGENIPDDELRSMIAEADRDGDGALNFEDFYKIMKRRGNDPLDCWDSSDEEEIYA
jgi:Ca2+-binding EF-hand superfamily protein